MSADEGASFRLYASEADARHPLTGPAVRFLVQVPGSADGLRAGAPVELQGIRVGQVVHIRLAVNEKQGAVRTIVTMELHPEQMDLTLNDSKAAAITRSAVGELIRSGMRARIASSNLVLGKRKISLVMTGQTGMGTYDPDGELPQIPAVHAAGIAGVIESVGQVTHRLGRALLESTFPLPSIVTSWCFEAVGILWKFTVPSDGRLLLTNSSGGL